MITAAIAALPSDVLVMCQGVGSPLEVLDAVMAGVDVFDSVYPDRAAEQGLALTFDVDPPGEGAGGGGVGGGATPRGPAAADAALRASRISLADRAFARDASPLLRGCACYSCTRHSRAYVHHLLQTHEMLAAVLLAAHNLHHYSAFFVALRGAVARSEVEAFAARVAAAFELTP